jgi:hypothetical protein
MPTQRTTGLTASPMRPIWDVPHSSIFAPVSRTFHTSISQTLPNGKRASCHQDLNENPKGYAGSDVRLCQSPSRTRIPCKVLTSRTGTPEGLCVSCCSLVVFRSSGLFLSIFILLFMLIVFFRVLALALALVIFFFFYVLVIFFLSPSRPSSAFPSSSLTSLRPLSPSLLSLISIPHMVLRGYFLQTLISTLFLLPGPIPLQPWPLGTLQCPKLSQLA